MHGKKAGSKLHVTPRETTAVPATNAVKSSIDVPPDIVVGLLGSADENLRELERGLSADLHVRGNTVTLTGSPADVALAERAVTELIAIAAGGQVLTPDAVRRSVAMLVGPDSESPAEVLTLDILSRRGKTIRPKTLNQKHYVDAIDANTIVFGIGPAGTGKTDPYLRPLYDALHDMMDPAAIPNLLAAGVIEVAPLAFMRGRSLNDAFIILDEAQNTTPEQMKMFLTRLGFGSKIVVTGDITQVDLPGGAESGLRAAVEILDGIDDIAMSELTSADVVRHRLVSEIVDAYEKASGATELISSRAQRRGGKR